MQKNNTLPAHLMTKSKFATMIGVNRATVTNAIASGKITEKSLEFFEGKEYINAKEASVEWVLNSNPDKRKISIDQDLFTETPTKGKAQSKEDPEKVKMLAIQNEAKTRELLAKAEISELKAAALRGSLIPVEEIMGVITSAHIEIKKSIEGLPVRIVDKVLMSKNRTEALNFINREINLVLENLHNIEIRIEDEVDEYKPKDYDIDEDDS